MSSEVWTESLLTLTALWLVNVIDENMKVNEPVAYLDSDKGGPFTPPAPGKN